MPELRPQSPDSTSDRWHAMSAGFLGWTLDAFDFFVVIFLLRYAGRALSCSQARHRSQHDGNAGHASGWRAAVRHDGRPLWPPASADGECDVLLGDRAALRLCAQLHGLLHSAHAVRHRHGRRVGRRRIAGHGTRTGALARCAIGNSAERLFHRVSAGCSRGASCAAELGLARDVLGRRHSRAAGAVHSHQGS